MPYDCATRVLNNVGTGQSADLDNSAFREHGPVCGDRGARDRRLAGRRETISRIPGHFTRVAGAVRVRRYFEIPQTSSTTTVPSRQPVTDPHTRLATALRRLSSWRCLFASASRSKFEASSASSDAVSSCESSSCSHKEDI